MPEAITSFGKCPATRFSKFQ